jgi:glycosyltransferase involved in cell wall biosynthesis
METTGLTTARGRRLRSPMRPLHVISLLYFYEPDLGSPEALLNRYATIRPLAHALRKEGANVTTLLRFHRNCVLEEDDVCFKFHADHCTPRLNKWQMPRSFHTAVQSVIEASREAAATVVHVHGLLYPLQIAALRAGLHSECAIIAQHHAGTPWRPLLRPLQKWGLRSADGFFFAAHGLARDWVERKLITAQQATFEVMEGSNDFRRVERSVARARTGLQGEPVVLWVGRLIPLKDPLTVLDGFERIVRNLPKARLYMVYQQEDLLPAMRERISSSFALSNSVTLIGRVPHSVLEDLYNSSDYFVLGSHYEGSSFSLAEALACGVVPVVTDIPSFRTMTDHGRIGRCWSPGNADAFASAFFEAAQQPIELSSLRAAQFFQEELSYPAIARKSIQAYQEVISTRTKSRT